MPCSSDESPASEGSDAGCTLLFTPNLLAPGLTSSSFLWLKPGPTFLGQWNHSHPTVHCWRQSHVTKELSHDPTLCPHEMSFRRLCRPTGRHSILSSREGTARMAQTQCRVAPAGRATTLLTSISLQTSSSRGTQGQRGSGARRLGHILPRGQSRPGGATEGSCPDAVTFEGELTCWNRATEGLEGRQH